jgi:hypothetical protein
MERVLVFAMFGSKLHFQYEIRYLIQIHTIHSGPEGALEDIREISGACHKHFRTKEQAEAFIEDWKEAYAEVWRRAVKGALDEGLRPQNMNLDTKEILRRANQDPAIEGISQRFGSMISLT